MSAKDQLPIQRTVIISDTHLGRPRAAAVSAAALRPLWDGAAKLIVNGDVAEVHHPQHWPDAARQTLHLHDLCEQDDVELTLLSGNHDPYISDLRHLHLAGRSVFVTHGDALHPAVAPWSPMAGRIREAYRDAISAIGEDERDLLEHRLRASQHAAAHVEMQELSYQAGRSSIFGMLMRPWAVARVLWYWRAFPKLAADFAARHAPQATYVVLGHTHHPGVWPVGERVVINTGSFGFPGTPRAIVLDERELTVWKVRLERGEYRKSKQPLATYGLPDTSHQSDTAQPSSSTIRTEHPAGQRATEQA